MVKSGKKTTSYVAFAVFVVLFFSAFSWASSWIYLQLRDFNIPVQGEARLTSADGWRTETRILLRDANAFWRDVLAREGVAYTAPELVTVFEGPRNACGGAVQTETPVYCPDLARLEFNRIWFNTITRFAPDGLNHFGISYAFAHLYGHHVQHLLGVRLEPGTADPVERRRKMELQAECFAGFWLRHVAETYGRVSEIDLSRVLPKVRTGAADEVGPQALAEDFSLLPVDVRLRWVRRGIKARGLADCDPFAP